jgi:hypothetical protein
MPMLQELIDELPDAGVPVPLPQVRQVMVRHDLPQWDRKAQYKAVQQGVIRPLPGRTSDHQSYAVDRDQAVKILAAALLALVAGAALIVMLRLLDGMPDLDMNALVKLLDGTA